MDEPKKSRTGRGKNTRTSTEKYNMAVPQVCSSLLKVMRISAQAELSDQIVQNIRSSSSRDLPEMLPLRVWTMVAKQVAVKPPSPILSCLNALNIDYVPWETSRTAPKARKRKQGDNSQVWTSQTYSGTTDSQQLPTTVSGELQSVKVKKTKALNDITNNGASTSSANLPDETARPEKVTRVDNENASWHWHARPAQQPTAIKTSSVCPGRYYPPLAVQTVPTVLSKLSVPQPTPEAAGVTDSSHDSLLPSLNQSVGITEAHHVQEQQQSIEHDAADQVIPDSADAVNSDSEDEMINSRLQAMDDYLAEDDHHDDIAVKPGNGFANMGNPTLNSWHVNAATTDATVPNLPRLDEVVGQGKDNEHPFASGVGMLASETQPSAIQGIEGLRPRLTIAGETAAGSTNFVVPESQPSAPGMPDCILRPSPQCELNLHHHNGPEFLTSSPVTPGGVGANVKITFSPILSLTSGNTTDSSDDDFGGFESVMKGLQTQFSQQETSQTKHHHVYGSAEGVNITTYESNHQHSDINKSPTVSSTAKDRDAVDLSLRKNHFKQQIPTESSTLTYSAEQQPRVSVPVASTESPALENTLAALNDYFNPQSAHQGSQGCNENYPIHNINTEQQLATSPMHIAPGNVSALCSIVKNKPSSKASSPKPSIGVLYFPLHNKYSPNQIKNIISPANSNFTEHRPASAAASLEESSNFEHFLSSLQTHLEPPTASFQQPTTQFLAANELCGINDQCVPDSSNGDDNVVPGRGSESPLLHEVAVHLHPMTSEKERPFHELPSTFTSSSRTPQPKFNCPTNYTQPAPAATPTQSPAFEAMIAALKNHYNPVSLDFNL